MSEMFISSTGNAIAFKDIIQIHRWFSAGYDFKIPIEVRSEGYSGISRTELFYFAMPKSSEAYAKIQQMVEADYQRLLKEYDQWLKVCRETKETLPF